MYITSPSVVGWLVVVRAIDLPALTVSIGIEGYGDDDPKSSCDSVGLRRCPM